MPAIARRATEGPLSPRLQRARRSSKSDGGLQRPQESVALYYVYLLQSQSHSEQRYVGLTSDLKGRLAKHNAGGVPHTSKFTPWTLRTYAAFSTREQAAQFEQ